MSIKESVKMFLKSRSFISLYPTGNAAKTVAEYILSHEKDIVEKRVSGCHIELLFPEVEITFWSANYPYGFFSEGRAKNTRTQETFQWNNEVPQNGQIVRLGLMITGWDGFSFHKGSVVKRVGEEFMSRVLV